MKISKKTSRYLISCGVALALSAAISIWQCSFMEHTRTGILTGISNGFFAAASLFIGLGVLGVISNLGGFHAMKYFGKTIRAKFSRGDDTDRIVESYYDFVKAQEQKQKMSSMIFLAPGIFCLIVAGVLCLLVV